LRRIIWGILADWRVVMAFDGSTVDRRPAGIFEGALMKAMLAGALAVGGILGFVSTTTLAAGSVVVMGAVVVDPAANPSVVGVPYPGYIAYSGHEAEPPASNCYWTRMPIYDPSRNVIGWRGRPVAVCPEPRISADAR
jgi:hypothetical protein